MTDMQVKAHANELKAEELAIRDREAAIAQQQADIASRRADIEGYLSALEAEKVGIDKGKLEELIRSNLQSEKLTEAADVAKYGYTTYMGPEWTQTSGHGDLQHPQKYFNIAKEIFETILNPFSLIGKIKGGK